MTVRYRQAIRQRRGVLASAALALGLVGAGETAVASQASNASIVVYHRFGESGFSSTSIGLAAFETHLQELRDGHYTVLPLPEIAAALAEQRPLPDRTVGISIDDAYLSVYREAWPRLRAAGLPFTVFVATEPLDRGLPGFMSWDNLREMVASGGVTVGNHGVSHGHMALLEPEAVVREITAARRRFEAELGATSVLFAYPYGEYSQSIRDAVASLGFLAAFGQHSGAAGATGDRFALPRFPLSDRYGDMERFRLVAQALPLPVADVTPDDPLIGGERNPPAYGFTVAEAAGGLHNLRCFASNNEVQLEQLGERRVEVRFAAAFPPGRARVNCTMPGPDRRWYWLGRQFFVTTEGPQQRPALVLRPAAGDADALAADPDGQGPGGL